MGHTEPKEMLLARWTQLINDPSLQDLPYKIELNAEGVIEMSPASNAHGLRQAQLTRVLGNALPHGDVITECSVLTRLGVRVPGVIWASRSFLTEQGANTPFTRAPEICVEVRSPSNTDTELHHKAQAYLDAGAVEVWIVDEQGGLKIYTVAGQVSKSQFGVRYPEP